MATIIFMVILLIITNIFADIPKCEKKSYCECDKKRSNVTRTFHIFNKGVKFAINVKSWSNIQIDCNHNDWMVLYLKNKKFGKIVESVKLKNCPSPENSTIKEMVKELQIEEIKTLSFQSYDNLSNKLRSKHLQGFSNVVNLILSHNGLTHISFRLFRDFPFLEFLDLSDNSLVLSKEIFIKALHLKQFDLNGNKITELAIDLFDNLRGLETLNLERNLLEKLNDKCFNKLSLLKNLSLKSNLLSSLPETIFYNLENLETIDLSSNYFSILPSELFNENEKLKKVLLNNNKGNLTTLPDKFFKHIIYLEEVQFRNNKFKSIPENLFWYSTSLKYIDFSKNFLQTLPEFVFVDVQKTEYIFMSNNMFETLPDLIFKNLTQLKVLDLSFNRISSLQRNLLYNLTELSKLNMAENGLKYIDRDAFATNHKLTIAKFLNNQLHLSYLNETTSLFFNNRLLKELDLGENHIKHFSSDWIINKEQLEYLNLRHNSISTILPNQFVFSSDKVKVDLRYNNISNILLNDIEELATYETEKRRVVIRFRNNPILCDCNLYQLLRYYNKDMPNTVYNFLQLKFGDLRCVQPNGMQGPQVNKVDFKTYQCLENQYFQIEKSCPPKCTCNIRLNDATRILDCSYKIITDLKINERNFHFIGKYPLILNLTGNKLEQIPLLNYLKSINLSLLLSNNNISDISAERLPTTLKVLQLHNNKLLKLNYDVSHFLYYQDFKELTLSGNPFICDCDARFLYVLVIEKHSSYKDLKKVKCKDKNIPLFKMKIDQLCLSNVLPKKFVKNVE